MLHWSGRILGNIHAPNGAAIKIATETTNNQ